MNRGNNNTFFSKSIALIVVSALLFTITLPPFAQAQSAESYHLRKRTQLQVTSQDAEPPIVKIGLRSLPSTTNTKLLEKFNVKLKDLKKSHELRVGAESKQNKKYSIDTSYKAGAIRWLKNLLFPELSLKQYSLELSWTAENIVSLNLGIITTFLIALFSPGLIPHDLYDRDRFLNATTWAIFLLLHLPDAVKYAKDEKKLDPNFLLASLISSINIYLFPLLGLSFLYGRTMYYILWLLYGFSIHLSVTLIGQIPFLYKPIRLPTLQIPLPKLVRNIMSTSLVFATFLAPLTPIKISTDWSQSHQSGLRIVDKRMPKMDFLQFQQLLDRRTTLNSLVSVLKTEGLSPEIYILAIEEIENMAVDYKLINPAILPVVVALIRREGFSSLVSERALGAIAAIMNRINSSHVPANSVVFLAEDILKVRGLSPQFYEYASRIISIKHLFFGSDTKMWPANSLSLLESLLIEKNHSDSTYSELADAIIGIAYRNPYLIKNRTLELMQNLIQDERFNNDVKNSFIRIIYAIINNRSDLISKSTVLFLESLLEKESYGYLHSSVFICLKNISYTRTNLVQKSTWDILESAAKNKELPPREYESIIDTLFLISSKRQELFQISLFTVTKNLIKRGKLSEIPYNLAENLKKVLDKKPDLFKDPRTLALLEALYERSIYWNKEGYLDLILKIALKKPEIFQASTMRVLEDTLKNEQTGNISEKLQAIKNIIDHKPQLVESSMLSLFETFVNKLDFEHPEFYKFIEILDLIGGKRPDLLQPSTILTIQSAYHKARSLEEMHYIISVMAYMISQAPERKELIPRSLLPILQDLLKREDLELNFYLEIIDFIDQRFVSSKPKFIRPSTLSIFKEILDRKKLDPKIHEKAIQVISHILESRSDLFSPTDLLMLKNIMVKEKSGSSNLYAVEVLIHITKSNPELIDSNTLIILEQFLERGEAEGVEVYESVYQALEVIARNRPDLVKSNSLISVAHSLPDHIRNHAFPHWKIYLNPHFKDISKNMLDETKFSVALSAHRILQRFNIEANDGNTQKAIDFVLKKRSLVSNKNIFTKGMSVINIAHSEARFNLNDMESLEKSVGIEAHDILSFKGSGLDNKEKILESIGKNKSELTLFFSLHGGKDTAWLGEGQIGNQENPFPRDSISFEELGDALIKRGNLSQVTIIDDMCFSYNYAVNLLNYISKKGSQEQPLIITSANYNRLGYGQVLLDSMQSTIKSSKSLRVKNLIQSETGTFNYEDPAIFIMMDKEDQKELKTLFPNISFKSNFQINVKSKPSGILIRDSIPSSILELSGPENGEVSSEGTPTNLSPKSIEIGLSESIKLVLKIEWTVVSVAVIGLLSLGLGAFPASAAALFGSSSSMIVDPLLALGIMLGTMTAFFKIKDMKGKTELSAKEESKKEKLSINSAIEDISKIVERPVHNLAYYAAKASIKGQKQTVFIHLKGLVQERVNEKGELEFDIPEELKNFMDGVIHYARLEQDGEKPLPLQLGLVLDSENEAQIVNALKENGIIPEDVTLFSVRTPKDAQEKIKNENLKVAFVFTLFPEEWPMNWIKDLMALLLNSGELRITGSLAKKLYRAIARSGFIDIDTVSKNGNEIVIPGKELGIANFQELWKEKLTFKIQA